MVVLRRHARPCALALAGLLCLCAATTEADGVLDPRGPIAAAERLILLNAAGIMLVVVMPVILLTFVFAWWYRAGNPRAVRHPHWSYSGQVELVVWSIPAMVVMLLAGVAWTGSHQLDPSRKIVSPAVPLRIEVVSLDWRWLFIYPDARVASLDRLVLPVDTPLELDLTSATVMNAFFVPQLGSQIYTMPGMVTHLNLLAEHAGELPGLSSHFSGDGFSDMRFTAKVVTDAEFAHWIEATKADRSVLSAPAYDGLTATASDAPSASIFGNVDPRLFEYIVRRAAPGTSVAMPLEAHGGGG